MSAAKPTFLHNVHLFRGIAIVLVVATHSLFEMRWAAERMVEFKVCLSLVQNGTVPFVFIAGLLFQHRLRSYRFPDYLKTKIRYVLAPYVVVSLPYLWLQHAYGFGVFSPDKVAAATQSPWLRVPLLFLTGAQMTVPLWFVPMICVLYLSAPIFAFADRNARCYWLLVPLLLLASFAHRPEQQSHLGHSILYFLPVYFAGMCASRFREVAQRTTRRYRAALIGVVIATLAFEVLARERPGAIESVAAFSTEKGVFDVNLYQKLCVSLLLLEALNRAGPWLKRALDPIARVSFGIFFLHYYVLYFARELRSALDLTFWAGGTGLLVLLTLAAVTVSMGMSLALQRVFGARSRYIIGC